MSRGHRITPATEVLCEGLAGFPGNRRLARNAVEIGAPPQPGTTDDPLWPYRKQSEMSPEEIDTKRRTERARAGLKAAGRKPGLRNL